MSGTVPRNDELLGRLPLAQLYRRAVNAKTPLDRHHHAYYLAEAALKLTACLRIGVALAGGLEPRVPLAQSLEQLCLPSVGHWVGFLRDATDYLRRRPDSALLPLGDSHNQLLQPEGMPGVRAFAERISRRAEGDEQPPLTPEQVRDPMRQGVLGFFNLIATYRNQVFGHGAQRPVAYYEEAGPLLLEAVLSVLRLPCLFGGLQLAVARLELEPTGREAAVAWQGLRGPVSLRLLRDAVGPDAEGSRVVPGQVYFLGAGVPVPLHPLVVYQEDRSERERIAFLNRAVTRRAGAAEEVRRCEYLDYTTGEALREIDARQELTGLLARLRGQDVTPAEVDRLMARSAAEAGETEVSARLAAGAVIGDFALEGVLGRGGMGVVYRARQRSLNRVVALKVLPPALAADPVALARFRREIAALARCDHPNLVTILTSGNDGDRHYYAMELVEGTNLAGLFEVLRDWRKQTGQPLREGHLTAAVSSSAELAIRRQESAAGHENPLPPLTPPEGRVAGGEGEEGPDLPDVAQLEPGPPPEVGEGRALYYRLAELFTDAADALAHLHDRGVLHRDLKPANLMLTADGRRLVIMDLGLAQLRDRSQALTRTGTRWVGTLRYCSPEQLQWNLLDVDERADVYGLGATLYELIALAPLFDGDTEPRLIEQVLHQEPGPPRGAEPSVPRDLAAVALHCLEKDRARRYASARDLAEDLERFGNHLPVRARPLTALHRFTRWCRRNRALATASGFAAAAFVAALIFLWLYGAAKAAALADSEAKARQLANANHHLEETNRRRHDALRTSAQLTLSRALAACERGETKEGLLWLGRALEITPPEDADLQYAIRANLAHWRLQVNTLKFRLSGSEVAFSPDGKTVLTDSGDNTARLWDSATGKPIGQPMRHEDTVHAMAFSPDGKAVLTRSGHHTARLWDSATGKPIGQPMQHDTWVLRVAFSPDGKTVLTGCGNGARLWQAATGKPIGEPLPHRDFVLAVAFSPNGKAILTGSRDNTARLWDSATGQPIGEPMQNRGWVRAVAFSPDGKTILTGGNPAELWDSATTRPIGWPMFHEGDVNAVAFSPDGKTVLTGSIDRTARLWEAATGRSIGQPMQHEGDVHAVAFSPDGKTVLTGSGSNLTKRGEARLWDGTTGRPIGQPMCHDSAVFKVAFSPDGKAVLTGSGDGAWLWEVAPGSPLGQPMLPKNTVHAVAFSPDGKVVLTGSGEDVLHRGEARLWEGTTGRPIGQPMRHNSAVYKVAFSPDGKTVLTGSGDGAGLWEAATGKPIGQPMGHPHYRSAVAFSPDGKTVLTGSEDHTARLWEAATGRSIGQLMGHDDWVIVVAFSPDGKTVLTGSEDHTARLWEAATGRPIGQPMRHDDWVIVVAFSPDGKTVLTASSSRDKKARLWEAATGQPIGQPMRHEDTIHAVAFSPDGKTVLTGSEDHTARLWEAATGRPLGQPLRHDRWVRGVAFRPDGKAVLTRSEHRARLWEPATGRPIGQPMEHSHNLSAVAFSPDGKAVLTGSADVGLGNGKARLWQVPPAVEGPPQRITLWTQVLTLLELDDDGHVHVLDAAAWTDRRRRLDELGGPPMP